MEGHAGERMTRTKAWSREQTWPLGIILNHFYDGSSRRPWKIAEHEAGKAGKGIEQEGAFIICGTDFRCLLFSRCGLSVPFTSSASQLTHLCYPSSL